MRQPITDQIKQALSSLVESHGFQVIDETYNPKAFGDAVVGFQSRDFALRVVRDRGQIFADVGPAQTLDEWYDLKRVLEFQGRGSTDTSEFELNELVRVLKVNYDELSRLFSKENYSLISDKLKRFEIEKAKERLAKLSSRPA